MTEKIINAMKNIKNEDIEKEMSDLIELILSTGETEKLRPKFISVLLTEEQCERLRCKDCK